MVELTDTIGVKIEEGSEKKVATADFQQKKNTTST